MTEIVKTSMASGATPPGQPAEPEAPLPPQQEGQQEEQPIMEAA
jgi:hypothetical protein